MAGTATLPARTAVDERARDAVAAAALALLVLASVALATGSGAPHSGLTPSLHRLPAAMAGPLAHAWVPLGKSQIEWLLLLMSGCYLLLLRLGTRLHPVLVVSAIVGLHVLFAIAPPLLSKDIFSYLSYARLGALYHVNPYLHGPGAEPLDPVYRLVSWRHIPSTYGPLFTLLTYPLAALSPAAALWTLKSATALAGLGCVALTAACARRLGRSPQSAAMWVGLNPVWLAFGLGGGHNDAIMLALAMAGVALALSGRGGLGAASIVASAAVKLSSAVALPFLILRERRSREPVIGALAAMVAIGAFALAGFGPHALHLFGVLDRQQQFVGTDSLPDQLAIFVKLPGVTPDVREATRVFQIAAIALLLWRVWRGADWIAGIGWSMLVVVVGSSWLLGWYTLWPLPFAAVSNDRRLRFATLSLFLYFVAVRWPVLLAQG
jgi:alpha-1,6-mannosyltransferase